MPVPSKYAYIDTTRGIAILLVIATHHLQSFASIYRVSDWGRTASDYPRLGVQLFFIASAYTLCLSMSRRSNEPRPLLAFYIRRFFRIAPLYYLAILLYALIGRGTYTLLTIGSSVVFLHGFVKSAFNAVVPGGWSISAEMMFYAWFPFAFIAARFLVDRYGSWSVTAIAGLAAVAHVTLWTVAPTVSAYEMRPSNIFWYWPPSQVPVFLIGIAAYFWPKTPKVDLPAFLLLTGLSFVLWRIGGSSAYAAAPIVASLGFVFLMRSLSRMPGSGGMIAVIGRDSYSMYIFHFLVVWYLDAPMMRLIGGLLPPWLTLLIAYAVVVSITLLVASISRRLIEKPAIAFGNALIKRHQTLLIAPA